MSTVATLGVEDAATHAAMLLDHERMSAYARAISQVVRPGDVVVDVGAGTGILAMLAARAGARRVFAIERASVAHLARRIVEANGLSSVIEVLRAEAREVNPPEPATVLLSETMGNFGVDEGLLALFALLARRSAPGVRTIPSRVAPVLCLIEDPHLARELADVEKLRGFDLGALRASLAHRVMSCRLRPEQMASEGQAAGSFRVGTDVLPRTLRASLVATRKAQVNALGGWFLAELAEGIHLDTGPLAAPTHWGNLLFPLDPPLSCEAGDTLDVELTPRLLQSLSLWSWTVRRGTEERRGDALHAFLGDARDIAAQLGGAPGLPAQAQQRFEAIHAAMQGAAGPAEVAQRLFAAYPGRYASAADAEQEIWAMLRATSGLL